MDRLLLKADEAAVALGFSRSKVYELLAAGELPSVRVGGSVRVPAEALRRWVDDRAASARGESGDTGPRR